MKQIAASVFGLICCTLSASTDTKWTTSKNLFLENQKIFEVCESQVTDYTHVGWLSVQGHRGFLLFSPDSTAAHFCRTGSRTPETIQLKAAPKDQQGAVHVDLASLKASTASKAS